MRSNVLKKILIVLVSVCLLCGCAVFLYTNDYYRATIDVSETIESYKSVEVEYLDNKDIVFIPKEENVKDCILFYPGGKVEYTSYLPLMLKLSNEGIMCILLHMPLNLAIMDINGADGYINRYPLIENWYLAGHSLGGACASMYLYDHINEYKGLILLGAYSSKDLSNLDLKVISIYGEYDQVLNKEKYEECKNNLPSNFDEYVIEGGCHAFFGSYGNQKKDGVASISDESQQDITASLIDEWINN